MTTCRKKARLEENSQVF
jgi:rubredoxin